MGKKQESTGLSPLGIPASYSNCVYSTLCLLDLLALTISVLRWKTVLHIQFCDLLGQFLTDISGHPEHLLSQGQMDTLYYGSAGGQKVIFK